MGKIMRNAILCPATIVLSTLTTPLYSADLDFYKALVKKNIHVIDSFDPKEWNFLRTKSANGVSTLESYQGNHQPEWRIISINERSPTKEEIEDYNEQRASTQNSSDSISVGGKLEDIILLQTIKLESKNKENIVLSFKPNLEQFKKSVVEKLEGRLVIAEKTRDLTEISISNTTTLKYSFWTKIQNFKLNMKFKRDGDRLLINELISEIHGTFAFVKKFYDKTEYRFTQYVPVGTTSRAVQ